MNYSNSHPSTFVSSIHDYETNGFTDIDFDKFAMSESDANELKRSLEERAKQSGDDFTTFEIVEFDTDNFDEETGMTKLEKSQVAQQYYDEHRSINLVNGYEKYVATDGSLCMYVNTDYEPENDDIIVFKLDIRRGSTTCQLYKPRKEN
jgi:hypothetical protein